MKQIAFFLHDIYFNRKSGRVVFKHNDIEKYFFFNEGNIIQVKTNQPKERLGEVLFKLEKISRDAYARMDDFIEPNMNIGEVFKSKGLISEEDLSDALSYQIRETILNTFPYFDADIVFHESQTLASKGENVQVSVPFLIEYGIRRTPFNPAMKLFLNKKIPSIKKQSMTYLLTEEEKKILNSFTGTIPAEKVQSGLSGPPEFFWKSLYLFFCLDLVELNRVETDQHAAHKGIASSAEADDMEGVSQISDVIAMRENLPSSNYYQILDVPKTASEEEIKKAYFNLARKFHPDRFERSVSLAHRDQIDEVFDAITNAYRTLANQEKRKAYDMKAGGGATVAEDIQDVARKAEIKFRQGKTLFNQERFDDAVALLEEAVRLRKDKGDYFLLLAMAESKIPTYRKKAEGDFLKAIALEAWNPEGYVGLGYLYKNEGLITKATKQFQKALDVDKDHKLALQELHLMSGGGKKKGLKGLLSLDVFGSKKSPKK